jgi:hypothetical protein
MLPLENSRKFWTLFRRQIQNGRRETAGTLFMEDGSLISNEKSRCRKLSPRLASIPDKLVAIPKRFDMPTPSGNDTKDCSGTRPARQQGGPHEIP